MRFLTFVFLFFGATVAKSALTGTPADANGVSTNDADSESKWEDFTSFIGEEVVMAAKKKMMNKVKCCLNIEVPSEMKQLHMQCIVSSVKISMQELGDGTAKTPTTKDWKRWYENNMACLIEKMNITTTPTGVDMSSFTKLPVENWVKNDTDKVALRTLFNSCAEMSTGATAVMQMISFHKCFVEKVTSLCTERDVPVGMMLKVVKGFLTLWDDSQCSGVQIPQKLDDTVTTCMAKAEAHWKAEGLAKFTSTSMMIYNNSDVKNAMYFLKMYGKNMLMYLVECGSEEMGFYNDTTGMFNYKAGEDFLTNMVGWNNPTVMNSVVMAFKGCEVPQNETELARMDEDSRDMSIFKTMMKFKKCFMVQLMNICGLNNDLAKVFFPVMHDKLVGAIGKDFKDKKGLMAIMHVIPALKEKFAAYFPEMNMIMNDKPFN